MPGMDGTGPLGYGPGTGGGFGRCHGRRLDRSRGYSAGYATAQYESRRTAQEDEPIPQPDPVHDDKLLAELAEVKERSVTLEKKLTDLTKMIQGPAKPDSEKSAKAVKPH
jgi:hypothetical protein